MHFKRCISFVSRVMVSACLSPSLSLSLSLRSCSHGVTVVPPSPISLLPSPPIVGLYPIAAVRWLSSTQLLSSSPPIAVVPPPIAAVLLPPPHRRSSQSPIFLRSSSKPPNLLFKPMGFTNAYIKTPCLLAEGGAQFLAQPSAKSVNIEYNSELKLEEEREIMSSGRSIFDLPEHIITDILSRLPIKTIIHCRCVCRTWRSLVLDPHFVNLHLSRTPTSLIIHQVSDGSSDWDSDILKLIEFDRDEHDQHGNGLLHYDPLMKFDLKRLCYKNGEIILVGSINGLLCFCDYENEAIFICNPIMRECITLPKPMYTKQNPSKNVYGFGYSSLSGRYKVVQISQWPHSDPAEGLPFLYDSQVAVYVLGTANWSWRSIGTVRFLYSSRSYNLSLNGNIHWLNCVEETSELICSFDVENESFQVFPSPPNILIKQTLYVNLGLFRDCLCLCVTEGSEDPDIVIWVMKEYGVKDSWIKEIVIRQNSSDLSCRLYDEVYLLHVWENGDILILCRDDHLYSYSPERKTLEEVEVPLDSSHIDAPFIAYEMMLHVPSFLSLKDFKREKVDMFQTSDHSLERNSIAELRA